MLLGLPWHFWLFAVTLIVGVVYIESRLRVKSNNQKPIEITIKMMGGPFDGQTIETSVMERPLFFIQPYLPEGEDGMPPEENKIATVERYADGEPIGKQEMYRPSYAYYQHITGDTYFYVRDVDEEELRQTAMTQTLPDVKPKKNNG